MSGWVQDVITEQEAQTLDGLFAERVKRSPDGEAYRAFERASGTWVSRSWRQIADEVARWQQALSREGLKAGDKVAVLLRNCPEWVIFDQAALSLGLVVVPLYTDDRPDNVAYILDHAEVTLLLVQDAGRWRRLEPAIGDGGPLRRVVLLESNGDQGGGIEERLRVADDWLPSETAGYRLRETVDGGGDALASIVYTSGTTGRPKGVMLSHRNMLWVAGAALNTIGVYREDVFLSFLPLSHTLERSHGYYTPMMAGSAVVFSRSVAQLSDDLSTQKPTVMITVPRIFERVYGKLQDRMAKGPAIGRALFRLAVSVGWRRFERQQGRARWTPALLLHPFLDALVGRKVRDGLGGRLRACAAGGAPLSEAIARVFICLGIPVLQGYGLTETSPLLSVNTLKDNIPASVGLPLPGLQLKFGDSDELLVRGPNVMAGYWKNPEATADTIDAEGWLHTGDQARLDSNGHLYITGRIKDILVLSNGEKIPPADMEMAIALDTLFEQVMVVGEGRPYLTALVVLNPAQWPELAAKYGLDPSDEAAVEDDRVTGEVLNRIRAALKDFPGYAKVRRVALTFDPWTIDNGLITPTLKVKRSRVLERYSGEVTTMYNAGLTG